MLLRTMIKSSVQVRRKKLHTRAGMQFGLRADSGERPEIVLSLVPSSRSPGRS